MNAGALIAGLLVSLTAAGAKPAPAKSPSISGVVAFRGAPPATAMIDRSSDPACGANAPDEKVQVKGGRLANVLVRVVGAPKPSQPPASPVIIDQTGCMYRPRVSGALDGQKILVRNADGTLHNVHAWLGKKSGAGKPLTAFNKAQTPGSPPISESFNAADGVLSVQCDIHPWMQAWVVPVESSFFAVTGPDGTFAIGGLPPGTYKLVAWHESLGTQEQQVKVPAHGGATVTFTYPDAAARTSH
ncbi:MAG: carboxypeptidase regulatory-like domain-containing protein [Myxococcaceae bacterium]|nr:carboxypeptidase regulatory-like domain-containing protein [Myxococcaceae bacterium]